jgi:hypothetical protein
MYYNKLKKYEYVTLMSDMISSLMIENHQRIWNISINFVDEKEILSNSKRLKNF